MSKRELVRTRRGARRQACSPGSRTSGLAPIGNAQSADQTMTEMTSHLERVLWRSIRTTALLLTLVACHRASFVVRRHCYASAHAHLSSPATFWVARVESPLYLAEPSSGVSLSGVIRS